MIKYINKSNLMEKRLIECVVSEDYGASWWESS